MIFICLLARFSESYYIGQAVRSAFSACIQQCHAIQGPANADAIGLLVELFEVSSVHVYSNAMVSMQCMQYRVQPM